MQVTLLCIGKTGKKFLEDGEQEYLKRLRHYISFQLQIIPDIKQAKSLSGNTHLPNSLLISRSNSIVAGNTFILLSVAPMALVMLFTSGQTE